jgi:hypothetical protein
VIDKIGFQQKNEPFFDWSGSRLLHSDAAQAIECSKVRTLFPPYNEEERSINFKMVKIKNKIQL